MDKSSENFFSFFFFYFFCVDIGVGGVRVGGRLSTWIDGLWTMDGLTAEWEEKREKKF